MKKIAIVLLFFLFVQGVSSQGNLEELRYSSEIETDDKYTFTVDVYTDDGSDVSVDNNHFGTLVSLSEIEITAISDPSKDNLLDFEEDHIFQIFKFEVDGKQITKLENLGILPLLVMPTQSEFDDGDSKNYINYYYSTVYGAKISTVEDKFNIKAEDTNATFDTETIDVDNWDLVYLRAFGILESMTFQGQSSDGDNIELQITWQQSFFSRLPVSVTPFALSLGFMIGLVKLSKRNKI